MVSACLDETATRSFIFFLTVSSNFFFVSALTWNSAASLIASHFAFKDAFLPSYVFCAWSMPSADGSASLFEIYSFVVESHSVIKALASASLLHPVKPMQNTSIKNSATFFISYSPMCNISFWEAVRTVIPKLKFCKSIQ